MRRVPKLQWIVFGLCIYLLVCVLGFLVIVVGYGHSGLKEPLSTGQFLFALLVIAPVGFAAYLAANVLLEVLLESGFRVAIRVFNRIFRSPKQ